MGIGLRLANSLPFSIQTDLWQPVWNTVTSRHPIGTNVFDRDWDLLVVLDACRVDALRSFSSAYPWVAGVDSMRSVGSTSSEWMLNTFTENYREEIENTAYLSRNIWSKRIFSDRVHETTDEYPPIQRGRPRWNPVDESAFGHYELISTWQREEDGLIRRHDRTSETAEHGQPACYPHVLTDRAIAVGRAHSHDRMIVHYIPPHLPFFGHALDWTPGETSHQEMMDGPEQTVAVDPDSEGFEAAKRGEISWDRLWELYRAHLHLALRYVDILIENIDAERVAITADHGNALGEHGIWGHPHGYPFSPVKRVPWVGTTARDERTYEPQYEQVAEEPSEDQTRERLRALGYL